MAESFTNFRDAAQRNDHRDAETCREAGPALSDHCRQILRFLPEATGKELTYRAKLMAARNCAAALSASTASAKAAAYAHDTHEVAGIFVFAKAPLGTLGHAAAYCHQLLGVAMRLEILESEVSA